ncbi:hypothetical protein [Thomasclavelia cocleata]|uniref:hypothetical protein n=1 Tax=Thomasclavelia cocleata TaxID=69824 RepID=UPI0025773AA9|nr:hypothetical protein [Thomasclavelia cocleata]
MSKDLEILKEQKLDLVFDNIETLKVIGHNSKYSSITDSFLLGVIVGKREERKKKAKVSTVQTDNTINNHIKPLIDDIKSPDALMLVSKYLEAVRQGEYH